MTLLVLGGSVALGSFAGWISMRCNASWLTLTHLNPSHTTLPN